MSHWSIPHCPSTGLNRCWSYFHWASRFRTRCRSIWPERWSFFICRGLLRSLHQGLACIYTRSPQKALWSVCLSIWIMSYRLFLGKVACCLDVSLAHSHLPLLVQKQLFNSLWGSFLPFPVSEYLNNIPGPSQRSFGIHSGSSRGSSWASTDAESSREWLPSWQAGH